MITTLSARIHQKVVKHLVRVRVRLSARIHQKVVKHLVTPTKTIVEVQCSAWAVEKDVSLQDSLSTDGLEVETRLLLPESQLPRDVVTDVTTDRLLTISTIRTHLVAIRKPLVACLIKAFAGVAPGRDSGGADEAELVLRDLEASMITS